MGIGWNGWVWGWAGRYRAGKTSYLLPMSGRTFLMHLSNKFIPIPPQTERVQYETGIYPPTILDVT